MTTWPEPAQRQDEPDDASAAGREAWTDNQEGQSDQPRLTVAAVARRLGVAPATLRTWDRRYGLGPTGHTSGSHRRYGPDDVARLEQMQRALLRGASPAEAARYARSVSNPLPRRYPDSTDQPIGGDSSSDSLLMSGVLEAEEIDAVPATSQSGGGGLKLSGSGPLARGLGRAALALDSWSAQRLLIESMQTSGVVMTWQEVVQPVVRAITERWHRLGSGSEALRLLADSTSTALRCMIANSPAPLNPRPILLASVPGEGQELELVALAAGLALKRVSHRLFDTPLPKEGFDAAIVRAAPAAVVMWAEQTSLAAPSLIAEIPVTRQRVRTFAAGPGWDGATLPAHVGLLDSLDSAIDRLAEIAVG